MGKNLKCTQKETILANSSEYKPELFNYSYMWKLNISDWANLYFCDCGVNKIFLSKKKTVAEPKRNIIYVLYWVTDKNFYFVKRCD